MTDLITHPGTIVIGNLIEQWSWESRAHVPIDILNTVVSIEIDWSVKVGPGGSASLIALTKDRETKEFQVPAGADSWGVLDADGRLIWAQRFAAPTEEGTIFTLRCSDT